MALRSPPSAALSGPRKTLARASRSFALPDGKSLRHRPGFDYAASVWNAKTEIAAWNAR